jgi:hypothetical protein
MIFLIHAIIIIFGIVSALIIKSLCTPGEQVIVCLVLICLGVIVLNWSPKETQ